MRDKVNLRAAFGRITEPWSPVVAGELNGQQVKLAKARGSYIWHHHEHEDELFLVIEGTLDMHLKDDRGAARVVTLEEGEFYIVPRGVEHKPEARGGDAHMLLFEPSSTRSTGAVDHAYSLEPEELATLEDL
ncbi:MAG: hypothetical protein CL940_02020 [Deltaproteobacteria bacterium]|nr:hypothetical protein [Deltaproteobacteria bacterium]